MGQTKKIKVMVNGERIERDVAVRTNLSDFLRNDLGLTGTHVGCEHGVCGACTVRVNGQTVRSCLMLAVQVDDLEVTTVEGLADSGPVSALRAAFLKRNALQCGYCTPGMLASAVEYIEKIGDPDRKKIREHLSGNYCRCTGYQSIVDAICDVIQVGAET